MALRIKRDADNKWWFGNDWNDWLTDIVTKTGGVADITASAWSFDDVTIVEEAETTATDDAGITYLVASGGTNGTSFNMTNTITYTVISANGLLNATDVTQSRTISVVLEEQ